MNEAFSQTGGARIDNFNATYPFATLSADQGALRLSCFGQHYVFPKEKIQTLSRHKGIFTVGLRIGHSEPDLPKFVVFWIDLGFWSSSFQTLKTKLQSLGYDVRDEAAG